MLLVKRLFWIYKSRLGITEDHLRYDAEHYVKDTGVDNGMMAFFKSIKDWKKVAKWLSNYAIAVGGVGLGTKNI